MGRIELFDYLRPLNRLRPLLTGQGRAHHGEILREAIRLAELGLLRTHLDVRRFAPVEAEQACS
jgi:NADPH2:quinone reductase